MQTCSYIHPATDASPPPVQADGQTHFAKEDTSTQTAWILSQDPLLAAPTLLPECHVHHRKGPARALPPASHSLWLSQQPLLRRSESFTRSILAEQEHLAHQRPARWTQKHRWGKGAGTAQVMACKAVCASGTCVFLERESLTLIKWLLSNVSRKPFQKQTCNPVILFYIVFP